MSDHLELNDDEQEEYRNSPLQIACFFVKFWCEYALGLFMDLLWLPGFIRAQHHESVFGPVIDVYRGCMRTTIVVNGLYIGVSRISGRITGVGYQPGADYKKAGITRPVRLQEPPRDRRT